MFESKSLTTGQFTIIKTDSTQLELVNINVLGCTCIRRQHMPVQCPLKCQVNS